MINSKLQSYKFQHLKGSKLLQHNTKNNVSNHFHYGNNTSIHNDE